MRFGDAGRIGSTGTLMVTSPNMGANPSSQTYSLPDYTFRYVIVAGTALTSMRQSAVDLRDHDRVMEFLESSGDPIAVIE